MKAEIICVGTELLLGDILNTDAQFLSRELASLGIDVHFQSTVGDNPQRLRQTIEIARDRCDLLVFSGGLGPTEDDLTKQTVAETFHDTLTEDAEETAKLREFFAQRGGRMAQNNQKQALVPCRGKKLPNANGTAPGAIFEDNGKYAVLLPGPPAELQPMFLEQVKPWLAAKSSKALHSLTLRVCGECESALDEQLADLLQNANPTAALYAKAGEVVIRITAAASDMPAAQQLCEAFAQQFYARLGSHIYGQDVDSIEQVVVNLLRQKGCTAATAESCTGGLVSQRITSVAGASEVFEFGVCTYANRAKQKLLGVRQQTLDTLGAVSGQTAAEMAFGVRELADSTYGLSITGIAGPGGGTPQKPVGTVYIAVCDAQQVYVRCAHIPGRNRSSVRSFSAQYALDMLRRLIEGAPLPLCKKFAKGEQVSL